MNFIFRYFLDTKFIIQKLKNKDMPEHISFVQFFIIMSFDWLQFTIIAISGNKATDISILNSMATFFITIFGILYLYICNNSKNGIWFLQKFFAFSVSVGWKFFVISFIASYVLSIYLNTTQAQIVQPIFMACLNITMFLFMGKAIKATL